MPPALPFLRLRRVVAMASVTAMTAFADTYHPAAPAPAGTGASNLVVKAAPPKYPYESIEVLRKKAVPGHPLDEALGGRTRNGTEITPRTERRTRRSMEKRAWGWARRGCGGVAAGRVLRGRWKGRRRYKLAGGPYYLLERP